MENLNVELTPGMLALIPIVAALIQVLKDKVLVIKYIPAVISESVKGILPYISIGIALGLLHYQQISEPLIPSIIIGLTACGGFDALKGKKTITIPTTIT